MSMHWNAEYGYGMFLNEEEATAMAKKFYEEDKENETPCDDEEINIWDLMEYANASIYDREENYYDLTGIRHLDTGERKEYVEGAMIYCDRTGTIFANEAEKKCFKDIHEMADYFRNKYGKYLPADFDYEHHLVEAWGANFC